MIHGPSNVKFIALDLPVKLKGYVTNTINKSVSQPGI